MPILEELFAAGAGAEILYDSRAHLGTDRLHALRPRLRRRLEAAGARYLRNTRLESIDVVTGPVCAPALLGPASDDLVCKADDGAPGALNSCMCPGGRIVASVNEPGLSCTNGMSNSTHSSRWADAALVTTFGPPEYGPGALAGVAISRELEARFFAAGRRSARTRHSSFVFGTPPARIDGLLPERARCSSWVSRVEGVSTERAP